MISLHAKISDYGQQFILAAAMFFMGGITPAIADNSLRFSADLECPWICDTPQNDAKNSPETSTGIMADILSAIFQDSRWQLTLVPTRWTTARKRLEMGEIDAMSARQHQLYHDVPIGFALAPSPIGIWEQAIWANRADPVTWRGNRGLKGKLLAANPARDNGATLLFYFEQMAGQSDIRTVTGPDHLSAMIDMLQRREVSVILHDAATLAHRVKMRQLPDLYEVTKLDSSFYYLAFTKRNPDALDMIDHYEKGLAALRQSGEFSAILAKYGLKDWRQY